MKTDLVGGICVACGHGHDAHTRRAGIWRMVRDGVPSPDIREAWPCWYPATPAAERMLHRDIAYCRDAHEAEARLWAGFAAVQRELNELRRRHDDRRK